MMSAGPILTSGYKTLFDPRPSLRKLENQEDSVAAWEQMWEELHHQGDIGDASYAAVPELVRIHRTESAPDWNLYGIVAIIELARTESLNPEVPDWLCEDYFRSIQELAEMGAKEILRADIQVRTTHDGNVVLTYLRVFRTDCDVPNKGPECWPLLVQKVGLKTAAVPTCIRWEENQTAGSSAVAYPVETSLFPTPVTKTISGPVRCWAAD